MEIDGKWFVRVIDPDGNAIEAPIGAWFITELFQRFVLPGLRK